MNNKTNTAMEEKGTYRKTAMIGTIVGASVNSSNIWIMLQGITGSTVIIFSLLVYDTLSNMLSIGLLFLDRMKEVLGGFISEGASLAIAMTVSLFISLVLCFAIVMSSIKAQTGVGSEKDKKTMKNWSNGLVAISGTISFVGMLMLITPKSGDIWTLEFALQFVFALMLSYTPALMSSIFANDISNIISSKFSEVVKSIEDESVSAIKESATEELRNENTTNLGGKQVNMWSTSKRTGTTP